MDLWSDLSRPRKRGNGVLVGLHKSLEIHLIFQVIVYRGEEEEIGILDTSSVVDDRGVEEGKPNGRWKALSRRLAVINGVVLSRRLGPEEKL